MPKLVLGACVRRLVDIGACGLALAGNAEQIVGGGVLELELVGVTDRSDGAHIRAAGGRVGAVTAGGRRAGISGATAPDEQGDAQKRNGGRTFANPAGGRNHAKSLDVSGYKWGQNAEEETLPDSAGDVNLMREGGRHAVVKVQ